ncbi:DNA repair protein rhp42 [Physcia stellaris]|nr:DNA repair protein rhp42 [Physcia stellaris]
MPPFIAQKRWRSNSPPESPKPKKSSLFEAVDQQNARSTLQDNKAFLAKLDGSDSDTSLSDVSSSEFEDVELPSAKKRKIEHDDDEEEIDWEDAIQDEAKNVSNTAPIPSGDLVLTLGGPDRSATVIRSEKKKGASKRERQIRTTTHCMHVQYLLFHNLVRNGWSCDQKVQETLVSQLPPGVKKEVKKWRMASGFDTEPPDDAPAAFKKHSKSKRKGGKGSEDVRSQRDWGKPAERQEKGAPNMSSADPVIRLLKVLAAYWKKRFTITAPGLRKQGYKSPAQLKDEITSFKNDEHDQEEHGERIESIESFRKCAKSCEGSRDVGVQLFTSLIRGLGIEARLVASLQPVGFGWTKNEEASLKKKKKIPTRRDTEETSSSLSSDHESNVETPMSSKPPKPKPKPKSSGKGDRDAPINLSDEDRSDNLDDTDVESVIDITPSTPRKKPNKKYDRDLAFPMYWVEAVSPITHEVYPVDPFILNPAVATNAEHLCGFESRGAKADKAKQVFAYVVAYSSDGTAKEVTTRYLKRHMWPGRTKGVRIPIEKVPVYNKRGKIKHHEEYDWFKTVMSGYQRPHNKRTAVDDLEEAKDLKPVKPEKKEKKEGEETLQGYKTSADYVLERHLRREEALLPGAEPVKTFKTGKGEKAQEEPVFLRKDVMVCRTGESWHKEGRQIKVGETPMKMVPVRAVTLTRKREVEEAQRDGGEKLKQGLYSWDQTDWIIPPPIENGVIPKNAFGNMDCYVPTMIPKGAVHIPLRSTMKICKRLGIDYAEAVTGFEFGKQRAVPVITGVVVAEENEHRVIDQWEKDEEERRRKEDEKREKAALAGWRKMIMGLRIYERVRNEYGGDELNLHTKEESNPFTKQGTDFSQDALRDVDENMAGGFLVDDVEGEGGGFLPEGYTNEEETAAGGGGGFLPEGHSSEDGDVMNGGGGFLADSADECNAIEQQKSSSLSNSAKRKKIDTSDDDHTEADHAPQPPPTKKRGRPFKSSITASSTPAEPSNEDIEIPQPPPTKKRGRPSKPSIDTPKPQSSKKAKSTPKSSKKTPARTLSPPATNGIDGNPPSSERKGRTPARRSARKSASAVKSKYFEGSSEDEDDEQEEEFEPESSRAGRRKTR